MATNFRCLSLHSLATFTIFSTIFVKKMLFQQSFTKLVSFLCLVCSFWSFFFNPLIKFFFYYILLTKLTLVFRNLSMKFKFFFQSFIKLLSSPPPFFDKIGIFPQSVYEIYLFFRSFDDICAFFFWKMRKFIFSVNICQSSWYLGIIFFLPPNFRNQLH